MSRKILRVQKIDFHWEMEDPFLFCAHHKDYYPIGDAHMGPNVSLEGRHLGEDFVLKDGFRMYHGTKVPGFPVHPHRGFETVTIVTKGFVDHFDSLGASGRYGNGDVQWLTTGSGCQHCEMFPLLSQTAPNPLELFQVWLNLPAKDKFTKPDFKMLWAEDIPRVTLGAVPNQVEIKVIAGSINGIHAVSPCAASYAAQAAHKVGIFLIQMEPHSEWVLPAVSETFLRNLYFYEGKGKITIDDASIESSTRIKINGNMEISIQNGHDVSYLALLEGEPIGEPVVSYGPFVMNTEQEIHAAYSDYQHTHFGGWKWQRPDPVNTRETGRYAKYIDGSEEIK